MYSKNNYVSSIEKKDYNPGSKIFNTWGEVTMRSLDNHINDEHWGYSLMTWTLK